MNIAQMMARAISDPGAYTKRGDDYKEGLIDWQVRAIFIAIAKAPAKDKIHLILCIAAAAGCKEPLRHVIKALLEDVPQYEDDGTPIPKMPEQVPDATGFNYTVAFGGGSGPDVWDNTMTISAVDIEDALRQAKGRVEEMGAWIFSIEQNP